MSVREIGRKLMRSGIPVLTPIVRDTYRLGRVLSHVGSSVTGAFRWFFSSREYTNFTYEISEKSRKYLAAYLAQELGTTAAAVAEYINEVDEDGELREYFAGQVPNTSDVYFADLPIKYGRRIGWYALIRVLKPQVIIESGIDRGVGSVIIAAALKKNSAEGAAGKLIGMDINPYAGSYIGAPYAEYVELRLGDSLQLLEQLQEDVDIFLHDSDHARHHELGEFERVLPRLQSNGLLISDNAEVTDALYDFAAEHGFEFSYWQEEPENSIFSGGGIGIARRRKQAVVSS